MTTRSKDQLPESDALALPDEAYFQPQRVIVHNAYEPAQVLTPTPTGMPTLKSPTEEFDWDKVLRDVRHVLADHYGNIENLAEWDAFIAKRKSVPLDGLSTWVWPIRPNDATQIRSVADAARANIGEGTIEITQPRHVRSGFHNGAEGRAANQAAARVREHAAALRRRDPPQSDTFLSGQDGLHAPVPARARQPRAMPHGSAPVSVWRRGHMRRE